LKKTSLAVVGAASLVLMFAMAAPMYAQDEEKPARQEEKTAQPARSGDKAAQENKEDKAAQENKGAPQKPETGKTTQGTL
jgi:hypothetical protein